MRNMSNREKGKRSRRTLATSQNHQIAAVLYTISVVKWKKRAAVPYLELGNFIW